MYTFISKVGRKVCVMFKRNNCGFVLPCNDVWACFGRLWKKAGNTDVYICEKR